MLKTSGKTFPLMFRPPFQTPVRSCAELCLPIIIVTTKMNIQLLRMLLFFIESIRINHGIYNNQCQYRHGYYKFFSIIKEWGNYCNGNSPNHPEFTSKLMCFSPVLGILQCPGQTHTNEIVGFYAVHEIA